jgi:hypothetical protein
LALVEHTRRRASEGAMRNQEEIRALIEQLKQRIQESAARAEHFTWGGDQHREAMRVMDVCDYQIQALTWVLGESAHVPLPGDAA